MKFRRKRMEPKFIRPNYRAPYEIIQEFYNPLVKYMLDNSHKGKRVIFKKVQEEHLNFLNGLMKNNKTKDLTLSVKLKRIREEFPELPISRSTV